MNDQISQDIEQAFLNLCQALGIQASALAYLEVPAIYLLLKNVVLIE